MKIWAKILLVFALILTCLLTPVSSFAHPGRTASDGCHYCRTNCDKWGVPWNERHCHGGGVPVQQTVQVLPTKVVVVPTRIPTRVVTRVPTLIPTRKPTPTLKPSATPTITSSLTPTPSSVSTLTVVVLPTYVPTPKVEAAVNQQNNNGVFSRFFFWLFNKRN